LNLSSLTYFPEAVTKKFLTVMRKIFVVAAMIIGSQLLAQDSSKLMDEVTLTASKFSIKTTQTGKVVTLITRQDIEHAGSRDLAQVITELGGVFINGFNSNLGKEKNIYLRGAKVDYTLITIDGVPVYDASGIGSNFDIRNISIDNVERIEILKGSQSTLYGSDAIAGVINIITKKGGTKPFEINGVINYGSFNTFRGNLNVNGSRNGFDYNVGFSHVNTDAFSEAKKPQGSAEIFDKDGYQQNSLNVNFGLKAGRFVRVQPFLRYSKFKGDLDMDASMDEKDYTNTNTNFQTGARNVITIEKGQINVQYQFIKTRRFYFDDSTKDINAYQIYSNDAYHSKEHFAEAFIVYPINKIKLTTGADYRNSNTDFNGISVYPPYPPYIPTAYTVKSSRSGDSVKQNQLGLYAALNYASNNFNIEGGGRFNHHSEYGSNFAFNVNPSYLLEKKIKLFANLSSGYKTPSLYQLFSPYGNRELKPESSLNAEAGIQVFTSNEKSSLRVDYFNRRIKDVIAFTGKYVNQDNQKDHGFEVEASSRLLDKIQLKLIYNYVNGEITTKQNGKDTTYFNLLRRPKSTFNFFVGSQLTKALYVNVQLNLIGERKDFDFFNYQPVTLQPYQLLNFYAEYALAKSRLKVFADLRNILDKDYSDIYGYNTAGFNAYGGIRFNF
jgi:vitamin B12 transporter